MAAGVNHLLDQALAKRASLIADPTTTAYRLFQDSADGVDGLVIERFGDVLIAQLHEERLRRSPAEIKTLVETAHHRLGTRAVYQKIFVRDRANAPADVTVLHSNATPWVGEAVGAEQVIFEKGLRFIIRPYDGFSVGLFLEHRENRERVRQLAAGRRVLNTFSYTGGFSVAAAIGGASSVSSVDVHKRYLEWGKQNFAANGLPTEGHWFFCSDIFDFYKRALRQDRRYDLIILDPPTFSRTRRPDRSFVLDEQLGDLCSGAIDLLDPDGIILLAANNRQISLGRMEEALTAAADPRPCTILERPELPVDFAGDPDFSKTVLAQIA